MVFEHTFRDFNPDHALGLWPEARQADVDDAAVFACSVASVETEDEVVVLAAHDRLDDALVAHPRSATVEVDRFDGGVIVRVTHGAVTGTAECADRTGGPR